MGKGAWHVLAITVIIAAAFLSSCASATEVKAGIAQPDISKIPDGAYEGHYFLFPVNVKVKTKIAAGRIFSIELIKHFNGQGKPAEAILPIVIERQSVLVDVISGATHSSVTILKAIENSLKRGERER